MLDWLGLSPAMTQLLGIVLIVVGVAILVCLGLFLYNKSKNQTDSKPLKQSKKHEEKQKDVVKEKDDISPSQENIVEIKEEKSESAPATLKKATSAKKKNKPKQSKTNQKK